MRLINADVFHRIFGIYAEELWAMSQNEMLHWIRSKTDIDAVPVVRCKDCVHYNELECNHIFSTLKDDDFCSYGERIENIGD